MKNLKKNYPLINNWKKFPTVNYCYHLLTVKTASTQKVFVVFFDLAKKNDRIGGREKGESKKMTVYRGGREKGGRGCVKILDIDTKNQSAIIREQSKSN